MPNKNMHHYLKPKNKFHDDKYQQYNTLKNKTSSIKIFVNNSNYNDIFFIISASEL